MSILHHALTRLADYTVAPAFGAAGYHLRRAEWADPEIDVDLGGARIVITGANSGIGFAAACALAARGAEVIMVCRSRERGEAAQAEVAAVASGPAPVLLLADLSLLAHTRHVVETLRADGRPIRALVNNAGALLDERVVTTDGFETTFAVHVLSPFLLTEGLLPLLDADPDPRVVTVTSGGMYTARLDLSSLATGKEKFDGVEAYAQAKRAQIILGDEWTRRHEGRTRFVAMHPGWTDTPGVEKALPVFRKVTGAILRTPEQGADTIVWLAAAAGDDLEPGGLYLDRVPRRKHAPGWPTRSPVGTPAALWSLCTASLAGRTPQSAP